MDKLIKTFRSIPEEIIQEVNDRAKFMADKNWPVQTGISYLDEAMIGVKPRDTWVIAGRSGQGKTELITFIAKNIAATGRKVTFMSLEDAEYSISRRIKWHMLMDLFYATPRFNRTKPRFIDWVNGRGESIEILHQLDAEASERAAKSLASLRIFYRDSDTYTIDDFEKQFAALAHDTDVFVLDHIHFFDYGEKESEHLALKRITKKISDLSKIHCKPVIAAAHVRKQDKRFPSVVPELEDIHGSSDVGKIATNVVTIGRSKHKPADPLKVGTHLQIVKCRDDMSVTIPTAYIEFNIATRRYEKHYSIGSVSDGEFTAYETNRRPEWAENAK